MTNNTANNKHIAQNTILLYFRMLFMMAVSLYTSRVILSKLGVEDFGIYNVVGGIVGLFSFLNGSMSTATQRYLTFEIGTGNIEKLKKTFSLCITIHAIIAIIIVILAETLGLWLLTTQMSIPSERMDAAMWVYQLSIFTCVVLMMSVPYNADIIAHEKMGAFAYISIFEVTAKLLIVYLLNCIDYDKLKIYAILMFCIQVIIRAIYGTYCKRHFIETQYKFVWDSVLMKEMLGFAGWNMFGIIASIGITQGVNIILNMFFGPIVNAARGIAVQVQNAITGFSSNFQLALNPQITKSYANHEMEQMCKLIFASSKYSFLLLYFLSLPLLIETDQVLQWWLKEVPAHTSNFVRIMLCISMINVMADAFVVASQATGKVRMYQILVGGTLLFIVPTAYVTLKLGYSPESVFFTHLLYAVLAQVVRIYLVCNLVHFSIRNYIKDVIIRIIAVVIPSFILPLFCYHSMDASLTRFLIVGATAVTSVFISIYFIGLGSNERSFIKNQIRKKLYHGKNL
ncbi:lipopolysaccharide biosynthesis protein [Bacteroides sp. GD17]|jgi:O-antigen/teichoic acid export membrane protein|uniref:lipopolysaccharide biosynthesis protein n=1 Tax=Bacteroides sp. GD17 TaxID=3139826 RepID=UPI0025F07C54|nr:lipopolysaccharide biosynthesis protein [uncultured Bacteroides sp.]